MMFSDLLKLTVITMLTKILNRFLYLVPTIISALPKSIGICFAVAKFLNYEPRPMIEYISTLRRKDLIGAEVGVSKGINAKSMFDTIDIKCLHAVDPYVPFVDIRAGKFEEDNNKKVAFALLKRKPVIWHIKTSVEASKEIKELLDFVYIDACHEYESVKQDIESWFSLVKSGGIIGGHDFWEAEGYGVTRAVREFASKNKLRLTASYADWWVIKP